ncbi:MAG TPA: hypothetical protein VIF38_15800, partial [Burkholderiales bacterium]
MNARISAAATVCLMLSACATPHVVQPVRVGDVSLSCNQLMYEMDEADAFRASADKERGATGTNVMAVLFFWPALLGTYSNINEAVAAADNRKIHLINLYQQKNCAAQTGITNPLARSRGAETQAPGNMDATADINEVDAVPFVGEGGKELYRRFLASKQRPRAFAISEKGASTFRNGPDAVARAKAGCEERGSPCFIYAYNDEIMFRQYIRATPPVPQKKTGTRPAPEPVDPRLADVHAVPNLSESGKDGYEKFLATKRRPRAFALSWLGAWSWRTGPDAEQRAKAACETLGSPCFMYVVDTRVVWDGVVKLDPGACDPARVDPKLCDIDAVPVRAEGKERYKAFLLINERPRTFV